MVTVTYEARAYKQGNGSIAFIVPKRFHKLFKLVRGDYYLVRMELTPSNKVV